jgi:hypothetical protein
VFHLVCFLCKSTKNNYHPTRSNLDSFPLDTKCC